MKLSIVSTPHQVLVKSAREVGMIDKKIVQLVRRMEETLKDCINPPGVGLAAPQVGESVRIFIVKPSARSKTEVFINPVIIKISKKKLKNKSSLEGCLSVKNTWAAVERAEWVELEYSTLTGERKKEKFIGYKAHIIQHEVDHLNGILFTYRALEQDKQLYTIEKEKGEEKLVPLSF